MLDDLYVSSERSYIRKSFVVQMESVARANANRTVRRFTSRSRLRAVLAVVFLHYEWRQRDGTREESKAIGCQEKNEISLSSLTAFLLCLSELQQIRLTCTEETLEMAIKQARFSVAEAVKSSVDVLSLVRTWLYDEGTHSDVSELCRDVLLAAKCCSEDIWSTLILHMEQNGQLRSLLTTIMIIRDKMLLFNLFSGPIRLSIIRLLATVCVEASERSEQVLL